MKKFFLFLLLLLFFFSEGVVLAESVLRVHLFYDSTQKTIAFDKAFSPIISPDKSKTIYVTEFDEQYSSPGPYELDFIDSDDTVINQIQFTPATGSFTIDVPDYSITKTIAIRKTGASSYILKQDISQYISCNNNRICEYEKGETDTSCIPDCGNSQPKYSPQTAQLLKNGNGTISDPTSGEIILKDRSAMRDTGNDFIVPPQKSSTLDNTKGSSQLGVTTNTGGQSPTQTTSQTPIILMLFFGIILILVIIFFVFRHKKNTPV